MMTAKVQEIAEEELGETADRRSVCLEELRDKLRGKKIATNLGNDLALLAFLRTCKFDVEKTAERMVAWSKACRYYSSYFAGRDALDPDIAKVMTTGAFIALSERTEDGRLVALARTGSLTPDHFSKCCKVALMTIDYLLHEPANQVSGVVLLDDLTGFNWMHALYLPQKIIALVKLWQSGYPVRVKGVHLLNVPHVFHACWNLVRPFLKDKFKRLVHMYSPHEFEKFIRQSGISIDALPVEYGGNGPTVPALAEVYHSKFVQFYSKEANTNWLVQPSK